MPRYHVNPTTGNPGVCRASKNCPYGDLEKDHYGSKQEAALAFEKNYTGDSTPYPNYPVWNDTIPKKLNDAIEYERLRQHTDEARRGYLLKGWEKARAYADAGTPLNKEIFLEIAAAIEPDSKGKYRTTPVTFANGGYAVPADQVETAMAQLIRFWPEQDASLEEKKHWLKECLIVHCLADGNGRTAWSLQQWLMNSWDNPQKLWDFNF